MPLVLIRGSNDVASAVAHTLMRGGYRLAIHDTVRPPHPRRGMSFVDALFGQLSTLEGVLAKRAPSLSDIARMLDCGRAIPVTDDDFASVVAAIVPHVLVDARMRKHEAVEAQRWLAPLTVGVGPGMVAGSNVDVAVETAWGERLGEVVMSGATLPLEGEPQPLEGSGRERYVYAPVSGMFHTSLEVGSHVDQGQLVARIGAMPVFAPLAGCLRGLTHDGAWVQTANKVVEVDPRDARALAFGLGSRPRRVAAGVLRAIAERSVDTPKASCRSPVPR